eukprot:COSAG02_NODE_5823_length_4014_cov_3.297829_1_plen_373_part_00
MTSTLCSACCRCHTRYSRTAPLHSWRRSSTLCSACCRCHTRYSRTAHARSWRRSSTPCFDCCCTRYSRTAHARSWRRSSTPFGRSHRIALSHTCFPNTRLHMRCTLYSDTWQNHSCSRLLVSIRSCLRSPEIHGLVHCSRLSYSHKTQTSSTPDLNSHCYRSPPYSPVHERARRPRKPSAPPAGAATGWWSDTGGERCDVGASRPASSTPLAHAALTMSHAARCCTQRNAAVSAVHCAARVLGELTPVSAQHPSCGMMSPPPPPLSFSLLGSSLFAPPVSLSPCHALPAKTQVTLRGCARAPFAAQLPRPVRLSLQLYYRTAMTQLARPSSLAPSRPAHRNPIRSTRQRTSRPRGRTGTASASLQEYGRAQR